MKLATTHLSSDLDGIASLVALHLLEPGLELVLPGSMDETTRRFVGEQGHHLPPIRSLSQVRDRLREGNFETLFVVDTADPERLGELGTLAPRFRRVVSYDTHAPTAGDLPRVPMPQVAACISALVLRLSEDGIRPSPEEAGLFLLGIHQDTGHFTFAGTRPDDHRAAAICLEWGAPLEWIARYVPKGFTSNQLSLLERMSGSASIVEVAGIAVAIATLELDAYEPELSVLLEQLRAAEEWPAAFLLAGNGDRISLIGRSDGGVDVATILGALGGGGHPQAASAALRGMTLREAKALLLGTVEEELGRRRSAGEVAVHPFVELSSRATIRDAARLIHRRRIDTLPLVSGRGAAKKYVGLVTRREVDAALELGLGERPVAEISALSPQWIPASAPIAAAREALIAGPRRLLLVGEPPGGALGILTRGVVFRAFEEPALQKSTRQPGPEAVLRMAREALGSRWAQVEALGRIAAARGVSLHLVGGTVRDLFLGRPIRDVDLVAERDAPGLAHEAAKLHGGKVKIHEAFGTATWRGPDGAAVDIASARYEHYEKLAALPRVALEAGLRQDLFRRDFTFNAIALSVDERDAGVIHDPYGGMEDLRAGLVRVLHGLSFHDDPTRAFRAARFAARFDFRLAPETLGLLHAARKAGAFEALGQERLGAELDRLLGEVSVVQAFRLLREWKLIRAIHPRFAMGAGFLGRLGEARSATLRLEGLLGAETPRQEEVLWIAVGSAIPRPDRPAAEPMVPGGAKARRRFREGHERAQGVVTALAKVRKGSDAARLLKGLELQELVYALGLTAGGAAARKAEPWLSWWLKEGRRLAPAVDGSQLMAMGFRPGPSLGRALDAARDAAWDGADTEGQLEAARRFLQAG